MMMKGKGWLEFFFKSIFETEVSKWPTKMSKGVFMISGVDLGNNERAKKKKKELDNVCNILPKLSKQELERCEMG